MTDNWKFKRKEHEEEHEEHPGAGRQGRCSLG